MNTPPTPPTPSSPPTYTPSTLSRQAYPQPPQPPAASQPQPPSFRQRKSSTIISFTSIGGSDNGSGSSTGSITPTTSPVKNTSTLPIHRTLPNENDEDEDESEEDDGGRSGLKPYDGPHILSLPYHLRNNHLERINSASSTASLAEEGESSPLLTVNEDGSAKTKWYNGPLFVTAVKLGILFAIFTTIVVGTFWFGMPKLDKEDKGVLKLPRSFADLQALNSLFQKYKNLYPLRLLACGVVSYLFVQTFSLPGSMYISILFGAAYGLIYGLLLSCLCESVGSLFCYTLSSLLAPPLLTLPFYRARVETWRTKIMGDPKKGKQVTWDGVFAFLIVLRIAPFPPHWVANFVSPHLGIGPILFWASCFIGIAPVSVIHCTIGSSLDSMTSAADFHLLSVRNILGLCAVVVAVLIPVGLKRVFRKDLGDLGDAEEVFTETDRQEREIDVPAVGDGRARRYHAIDSGVVLAAPSTGDGLDMRTKLVKGKGRALEIIPDGDEEDDYEEDQAESSSSGRGGGGGSSDYEIYDPNGRLDRVEVRRAPYTSLRGYGSIQPQPVSVPLQADMAIRAERRTWWPFGGAGVAVE
ncbi:hypothetical protein CI109_104104 [Kwoniella shandongensis]|uniref:Uncharacterized protein n=1 Tax=Kwoniella shandongensis TaxID=1734106 RepID=A0A5M6C1E2_9TREE|nr:uncharacterized protein CI109_002985 [Kwoniella shandongensis]KAA5528824.1 hypothetical protein CI109_002985 [Kwoniella shandongensis]